jgi:hypothetical protein
MDFLFNLAEIVTGAVATEEQMPHDKQDDGSSQIRCVIA